MRVAFEAILGGFVNFLMGSHIAPSKEEIPNRKAVARGFPPGASTASAHQEAAIYVVSCSDGLPHIVKQSQIIQET